MNEGIWTTHYQPKCNQIMAEHGQYYGEPQVRVAGRCGGDLMCVGEILETTPVTYVYRCEKCGSVVETKKPL
jgi:hypothetical protein